MTSVAQSVRVSNLPVQVTKSIWHRDVDLWWLVALLSVALAIRLWLFRGFFGSDDVVYATRGLEVLAGLWTPFDYNGALRYGMNIPIAAAVGLFGRSEGALAAWGLTCSLGEIALVYAYSVRVWGTRVAVFAGLVLATIPQHIDSATNIAADAPFSALLTLAMVLLHFAARTGKVLVVVGAGLSLGFAGWIKPEAALVFSMPFAIMAFTFMRDWRQLVWLVLGAAAATGLNLALFAWAFHDPFYYAHVLARQLQGGSGTTISWQSSDANYYFRLLFLDGRVLWLAPMLALPGAWLAVRAQDPVQRRTGYFTVLWACLLLLFFSFFIYSVNPLRWIPKQSNYAIIFAAPISVLAGVALARLRVGVAIALAALLGMGGLLLAALDGYGHHLHAATHRDTIRFARGNKDALVFASGQTLSLNHVFGLLGKDKAVNLLPLKDMAKMVMVPPSAWHGRQIVAAYHSEWPEARGNVKRLFEGDRARCMGLIAEAAGEPSATDTLATAIISWVRAFLPAWADRQVRFTDKLLLPEPVRFYSVNIDCLAQTQAQSAHYSNSKVYDAMGPK